jgi:hypothetical protein
MNSPYLFLLVLLLLGNMSWSQEAVEQPLEQKIERLAEASEKEEIDFISYLEVLNYFRAHPIHLNHTRANELAQLGLLNDVQISNLLHHIEKNGKLLEMYELQSIEGFNLSVIQAIVPYVTISEDENSLKFNLRDVLREGSHSFFTRAQQVVEPQKGFLPFDSTQTAAPARYVGGKEKIMARYRFTFADKMSAGVLADKDAGELFFKNNLHPQYASADFKNKLTNGFDFYSAHLFFTHLKKIKTLALGDYHIDFGQGLTAKSSFRFGKTSDAISVFNHPSGIRPHTAADENLFMRGAAITLEVKSIQSTVFFSKKKIDANVIAADSVDKPLLVSSFQTTGLHSTLSELVTKQAIVQTVFGGNVQFQKKKYHVGITGMHTLFDAVLQKTPSPYNHFSFNGKEISNAGIEYAIRLNHVNFFGEASLSSSEKQTGYAFINGCILAIDPKVALSLVHRDYAPSYQNLFSNGFSEGSSTSNEKGIYWGILINPIPSITINAYADCYKFPWLKYRVNAPSYGKEYLFQLLYNPTKQVETYLRIVGKERLMNSPAHQAIDYLATTHQYNYRWNIGYKASPSVTLHNRIELLTLCDTNHEKENGFLFSQDVSWKPTFVFKKQTFHNLSITLRYALFDSKSYSSRIYQYEADIPGSFSIPSYYYKGSKGYVLLHYQFCKALQGWVRFSQLFYADKNQISAGTLNEINGSTKSELKLGLKVDW